MNKVCWSETQDRKEWDDFVSLNGGGFFHFWSWRNVLESTGARPLYLACRDGKGNLDAVCPFFYDKMRVKIVPRTLLVLDSLPCIESGPHIAGPIISRQITNMSQILESLPKSVKFSILNPVVSMVLRVHQQSIVNCLVHSGFNYRVEAGDFILDLSEKPPEYLWNKVLPKDERKEIRYFERCGFSLDSASRESDYADFFNLYQESMCRQGYDANSYGFFKNLRSNLDEQFRVLLLTSENNVIAGFGMLCDTKNSEARHSYVGYSPNTSGRSFMPYVYWKIINWASQNGFKYVNFGRTSPDPTDRIHRIKQKFGGEFVPEYKFVLPVNSKAISFARLVLRRFQRS
ncbi:MAG: GNAT family N-acetyltransferase [Candidatus Bathyarchaeia archaeon]|jgi:hypothetical protein